LELLAQGYNQTQIATELQFDKSTISDDVKVLREESKERIRSHLEERLPLAYDTCLDALMDRYIKRENCQFVSVSMRIWGESVRNKQK
jgi:hypothetical protein